MEPIPARILRRLALACPSAPPPTEREMRTRAYIVEAATNMFAEHGTHRVQMKNFAESCGVSPSTIRRHVCDMHYLFRLVLTAHLDMLLAAIGQIPDHHQDRAARARAEYHRLTRDHRNQLTPIHALLVRHRFALPDDQRDPVEDQRRMIGVILAGSEWESAFDLLDGAAIALDRIEAKFSAEPAFLAMPAADLAADSNAAAGIKPAAAPHADQPPRHFPLPRTMPFPQPGASRHAILAATSLATPPPQHRAA